MIVVAGESLIDLVPADDGRLAAHCGGGPFNTARALARLGQQVAFLGCISDDTFGRERRQALSDDGVGTATVVDSRLPTTLALAALSDDGAADYRFYTEATAAAALTSADAVAALPITLDALVGGSLGLMLEPLADAILTLLESDTTASALTLLDPNIRASLIPDRAAYAKRLHRALRRTDVLKASKKDLSWIEPELDPQSAARQLLRAGPGVALITLGAQGALVVSGEDAIAVSSPPVEVVDTIGAGDAFTAGFLASWLHRGLGRGRLGDPDAVAQSAEFACMVASRTCERAGANPPTITL
jgi:fructokinase